MVRVPNAQTSGGAPALLLGDLAALPGMEGAAAYAAAGGALVGMLTLPFSVGGHDLPVIIPAAVLAAALSAASPGAQPSCGGGPAASAALLAPASVQRQLPCNAHGLQQPAGPVEVGRWRPELLRRAALGVVGVALPLGHWASGVLISQ